MLQRYFSTLRQQNVGRTTKLSGKKPLNLFLGELFPGKWEDHDGLAETESVCEQVRPHPPTSEFCIRNEKHGVQLQDYSPQRVPFASILSIVQYGHANRHYFNYNKDYVITFPSIRIKGVFSTSSYSELEGETFIYGSNYYVSHVKHEGKQVVERSEKQLHGHILRVRRQGCFRGNGVGNSCSELCASAVQLESQESTPMPSPLSPSVLCRIKIPRNPAKPGPASLMLSEPTIC